MSRVCLICFFKTGDSNCICKSCFQYYRDKDFGFITKRQLCEFLLRFERGVENGC